MDSPPPIPQRFCAACGARAQTGQRFCSMCGKELVAGTPWYYQPASIVLLAFLVLGPFALPLVWKTPKFTRSSKILWILVILVYTGITIFYFWKIAAIYMEHFRELQSVWKQIES